MIGPAEEAALAELERVARQVAAVEDPVERYAEAVARYDRLGAILATLTSIREEAVLEMHEELHMTFDAIGQRFGIHRARANQLEKRARERRDRGRS